jgi:predicted dehydrogenase
LKTCFIDPQDIYRNHKPQMVGFPQTSTERAELEHFALAVEAGTALAVPGGDEEHNVAILEAILRSASDGSRQDIAQ